LINKRIIGVINVKDKIAVQSFGFNRYLPLGDPIICAENLNRWKVDEILVHVLDQPSYEIGPDFELLKKISSLNLTTPLIYGGGIRNKSDAQRVIEFGADRISISNILNTYDYFEKVQEISMNLGSQAIVLSIPSIIYKNIFYIYNYKEKLLSTDNLIKVNKLLSADLISEIILIDKQNEGFSNKFNEDLLKKFPFKNINKILFGGISKPKQIDRLLSNDDVAAVAIGNFLNYKECAYKLLKRKIEYSDVRK